MPNWLENGIIDEVSLVPRGANRRRFTVFKQHPKSQEDDMPDLKELLASLGDLNDEQKTAVRKALAMEPVDVFDKLEKATDEQKAALAKALGIEPAEDDKTMKARIMKMLGFTQDPPADGLPEGVTAAIAEVKAEVTKADARADAAETRLKAAEETIAKRDKESRVQRMVTKAAAFGGMGNADDLSALLTDVDEKAGPETLKKVEAILAKGEEALKQAKVFDELGRIDLDKQAQVGVLAEIDAKAVEIQKGDSKMSLAEARAEAWKANPDLYSQYQSERKRAIRAQED